MALSLIDGKVQLRSDNGTWYEFPLVRLLNRVTEGDIVEAAEVAANADESAYLEVDEGNGETSLHRVYFVTGQDDRQYLEIDQEEAESDAVENGPMRLTVDGQSYDYTLERSDADNRIYDNWVLAATYTQGYIYRDLSARFYKQQKKLTIRSGDDARDVLIVLYEAKRSLETQPDRLLMKIDMGSDGLETREFLLRDDGVWAYRMRDYDYTIFLAGEYDVQLYGYWPDLSNSTWPTKERDAMTITIVDKLTGEED